MPYATSNFLIAIIASALIPAASFAQIDYVSASRSIRAYVSPYTAPQVNNATLSSTGLGDFSQSLNLFGTAPVPGYGDTANSSQSITSSLDPASITISGTYNGNIISFGGTSRANGSLNADIVFNVTSSTPYSFSASTTGSVADLVEEFGDDVILTGPSVSDSWPLFAVSGYNSYSDSGTLAPGQYRLLVDIESQRVPFGSVDDVENPTITLVVPEPAELFLLVALPLMICSRRRKYIKLF